MTELSLNQPHRLPELDHGTEGVLEVASAEAIITDEGGEHRSVTLRPVEHKHRRGVMEIRDGDRAIFHPRRMNIEGVAVDRGDGHWQIVPADRVSCIERQYGGGINELLLRVRVIEPVFEEQPRDPSLTRRNAEVIRNILRLGH